MNFFVRYLTNSWDFEIPVEKFLNFLANMYAPCRYFTKEQQLQLSDECDLIVLERVSICIYLFPID